MKSRLILVVDRDTATREILGAAFEHAGYRVLTAENGMQGLRLAFDHEPDVVVGDFPLEVPGHSPFTAALRRDPRFRGTPVLSVTARATAPELKRARAVADEVLLKPVPPSVVLEVVGRLLGSGTG
jgi:chemosensory pili system protein ChpA (sensor histidine kinase/response regulator)